MTTAASGTRLSRGEWIAIVAAVAIAHLFYWRIVLYPSDFDARNYLDIAADIGRNGLFSKFYYSDVRTYGYPLLLLLLARVAEGLRISVGFVVFEFQLTLYLAAAYVLRRQLARIWPTFAQWAFIGIALNIFALSYTPESLTESVSLSLIVLATACWTAFAADPQAWRPIVCGSVIVGAAVMVRPANLFLIPTWVVALAAVCVARRVGVRAAAGSAAIVIVCTALPMIPQYVNNVAHYGRHTPLVTSNLARNQQVWGITYLKYATALAPVPNPSIFYENRFASAADIDNGRPLTWYVDHPRGGALTLALHVFNMLDQDLLFTYSRDLDPWYRRPIGVFNHALVALGVIGIGMLIARARRDRSYRPAAIGVVAYVVAHLLLHATSAVEMRFGLPLLLLAGPAAIGAVRALADRTTTRWRSLVTTAVVLYVLGALALSDWVRQQAPSIRAWQTAHGSPAPFQR